MDVAALVAEENDGSYAGTAVSLAVLAGIAASDAACCRALGRRSRGDDRREAAALLAQVEPGGSEAANALTRLLSVKNDAQYGFAQGGGADLRAAMRQAATLVAFAQTIVAR
jgi:hypothetical protein